MKEIVLADSTYLTLLDDPIEALHDCFGGEERPAGISDMDWQNHLYSTRVCFPCTSLTLVPVN
jgi:hypothetical protein